MKINYLNLLDKRIASYKNRYKNRPIKIFLKLVFWSLLYPINKFLKTLMIKKRDKNKLYIGIAIGGGMGDILISANYIMHFKKFVNKPNVIIDCYSGNLQAAESMFANSNIVNNLYKNKYHRAAKQYDLYFSIIEPFPNILYFNRKKISKICPNLLEFIDICLKNEELTSKIIEKSPTINTSAYIISMIQGRNRVQMNDVENLLNIEPTITFTPNIDIPEIETLMKFNLNNKKYITLNRCVGELNYFWDSMKMWKLEYYIELINLIKEKYPDYVIVQVGYSVKRSPLISGVDMNLVEKTTLNEMKTIIKNATLHIDGEGGLVHLRHALRGGSSIVLFGPTSSKFYGYPENFNIESNSCPHWCDWAIDEWQTQCLNPNKHICLNTITPSLVFEHIEKALEKKIGVNNNEK